MPDHAIVTPGDLGRRLLHRRRELGLSREELATRAGMASEYVRYLEEQPARLSIPALLRLAGALDTTSDVLLGADLDLPPGSGGPALHPRLHELDREECLRLLAPGGIGRIAITTAAGPEVLPINYTLLDDTVIVRTSRRGTIARHADSEIGFEADHIDEALSQGWSVLITGRAHPVTDPQQLRRIRKRADPRPWPGGVRDLYLQVEPNRVTGRRIDIGGVG